MKWIRIGALVLAVATVSLPASGYAQKFNGKSAYSNLCASCHGTSAKGDGPVAVGKILDNEVGAVPAAGSGLGAIGHWSSGGAFRSSEQQPQRSTRDIRECRGGVGEEPEPEVLRVPREGRVARKPC